MTIRLLACVAVVLMTTACKAFERDTSPSQPTPVTPPAPNQPVRYTALGASDALGVGGSSICLPLTECPDGTGYTATLARELRRTRDVRFVNLGIPGAVLSGRLQDLGRKYGRDTVANILDRALPAVLSDTTLVTILTGGNDANIIGEAARRGEAGSDLRAYVDAQVRAYGNELDQLVRGVRSRAPSALVIVLNLPNLAGLPYSANRPRLENQVLQAIAVGLSREANRQAGVGINVLDVMCDPALYAASNYSSDGFHPNDAGYAHLASRLLNVVNTGSSTTQSSCSQMTLFPPF